MANEQFHYLGLWHFKEVLAIERDSFEYPWTEEDFVRVLRQSKCLGVAAEIDNKIVGYMIYDLHDEKTIQLLNFAVHRAFRRRGVGRHMIQKLIGKLSTQRRTKIVGEVMESNLPAQLFLRSAGFYCVSLLRNYYDGTDETAYRMRYDLVKRELRPVTNRIKNGVK